MSKSIEYAEVSGEKKAPGMGRRHTRDPQIELPWKSIAVQKARELYEMRQLYRDLERLRTPFYIWIILLRSKEIKNTLICGESSLLSGWY